MMKSNKLFGTKVAEKSKINLKMKIHHIAIICSHYQVSKRFYTEILGLNIITKFMNEKSYKLDLAIGE